MSLQCLKHYKKQLSLHHNYFYLKSEKILTKYFAAFGILQQMLMKATEHLAGKQLKSCFNVGA